MKTIQTIAPCWELLALAHDANPEEVDWIEANRTNVATIVRYPHTVLVTLTRGEQRGFVRAH